MTDQNPPQPPSGDGSQETWRQPSNPWQKSTDAGGPPASGQQSTPPPAPLPPWGTAPSGQTSEEQTHLAWPGTTPQPASHPQPGGQQWGAQPSPEQSWPPQQPSQPQVGAAGWGQPGTEQGWGQQPGPDQGWGQQPGADQGWGAQQAGGWPQQPAGYAGAPPTGPYQGTSPQYPGGAPYQQENLGGYPNQVGGYPPPGAWQQGAPPPPPHRKKTNPVLIIVPLAVVAAIVLGVVIALAVGGGDDKNSVASPVPTPAITNLPQVPGTLAPAPTPATGASPPIGVDNCVPVTAQAAPPAGVAAIGGSGTVVGEANSSVSDFEAKVTLNSICSTTGKVTDYGDPPVQGAWYVINVTVEVSRGDTSASPSDFYIQTEDGTRYDGSYDEVPPRLSATDVKVGQKVRGNIVIDAPPGHGVLNWEPLFAVNPAKFQL